MTTTMPLPRTVTRDEWLSARRALLAEEKAFTRARDAINARRRELPAVALDKAYAFETSGGSATLAELFEGRGQLIVYHFMFLRDQNQGCPGCSFVADNVPHLAHFHARDTTFALVSRAPLAELEPFRARMGWAIPWHSSYGSDFNYDFHATTDEAVRPVEYNYRSKAELEALGHTYHISGEQPGLSVFLKDGDRVLHTYSCYGRGLDLLLNTYNFLDLTPYGRGEGWGGMPDVGGTGKDWLRHHDRY
jgi:predicted dithiol-disulfide oxidoreductase (DUF899 family)